jgi:outer membrane protein assembly factor BamE (lipoprotein component of BamABCDE complex)
MFFKFKNHYSKVFIILFIILNACQLQEPSKNHGIIFLENRSNKLVIKQSNKNDIIRIMGQPHSKSINNENIWFYMERTLSKGKYHKLGKHILTANNVLVLQFDNYGILETKELLTKSDLQKVAFTKNSTKNELTRKSFVEKFLSSIKQKMYKRK